MTWEDARISGLCLGALLLDDRSLSRAALGAEARGGAEARLLALPSQGPDKVEALRKLIAEVRPALTGTLSHLPPRARALVAQELPRAEGRAVLRAAPPARPGYEAEAFLPGLIARLAWLAGAREDGP